VATMVKSGMVERRGPKHKKNHMKAAGRAKKNRVAHLRKDDGHITQHKKEMKHMAQSFFMNLYHAIRVYTQMSCCIYSNHELHNI
jgi:hypothetical protein